MKKTRKIGCIVWSLVLVSGVCLMAGMLVQGVSEFKNLPRQVSGFSFGVSAPDRYVYSSQQQAVVSEWGPPQSFYILFYQREGLQGQIETVRYEEWSFPARGKRVVFENGDELSRGEIPKAAIFSTQYSPEQFLVFMNREQLAALTGLADWLILPVEKELVQDADLYYAEGLTFGLQHGELVYIEAMGFEE